MRYFGYGYKSCWVESAEREKRTFYGFTLHKNQVFGKDRISPFVLTRIVERSDGKSGVYATVQLYRLHKERGWYLTWERSDTTVNAIDVYKRNNRNCRVTRESAECNVNPLQEVKGQKYFQLLT